MQRKWAALVTVLVLVLCLYTLTAAASSTVLKEGMSGSEVTKLQDDLRALGYFHVDSTGYYGPITAEAVRNLQRDYGLEQDGIAGPKTFSLIDRLLGRTGTYEQANRGESAISTSQVLKKGMSGDSVMQLQNSLKALGYFYVEPTGYYGDITVSSVLNFQRDHGLEQDGVAGPKTLSAINNLLGRGDTRAEEPVSRGNTADASTYLVPWFGEAEYIFSIGDVADVLDIETGLSFKVKRTYGYNHADVETLTQADTDILLSIYGGQWSWVRRAIVVTVNGRKMAASMAAMPHAGLDSQPANAYIDNRSGDYGTGYNLDAVKGNGMDGVFDIHFLNSKGHASNSVNQAHQDAVQKAARWAAENY